MRRFMILGSMAAVAVFASLAAAQTTPAKDIVDTLAANGASKFVEALKEAKLDVTLRGAGPFTVYAPDDKALGATKLDAAALKGSIALGKVGPDAKTADTLAKTSLVLKTDAGKSTVNGVGVSKTVAAKNGLVVLLAGPLPAPSK